MNLTALVVHARHVPSEARERFGDQAAAIAADPRAIVLRTCHRVELYVVDDADSLALPDLPAGGVRVDAEQAARHLFTVAAGLDSVVLGEDQVLHQLRECVSNRHLVAFDDTDESCRDGSRGALPADSPTELVAVLDRLFQLALHVGRQTRAWREGPPHSLADVALDRVERGGSLAGREVLIVGAGQMSRLAAFAAMRRDARVVISNRTADRAARLAADVGGTTVEFGEIPLGAAGVIAAVAGPWRPTAAALATLAAGDNDAVTVDLSSPPSLEESTRALLGERYVSVDDIARGPAESMRPKLRRRMERLIDEAVAELARWVTARSGVPTIQALTQQAEARRAAEVERLLRRMPNLPEHERELVEQMSHRLVAGLLHAPLASLRDDQNGDHDQAVRELFAL